ncbi:Copper resistance protein CRF1 [Tolypocladium ophioglossoides CBS 100239]|uniref:Copper resistance protein CRF1 n=1 Tax=Tolypocladium ophioglossoides (strain CBS 100239) TaxID=1163406 RepID=A0A0L0N8Z0_TOLOC|nr:Copper resistance protein CRF1 [Tolypocladium ophioglossoides CBS 100239]
MLIDGEKYACAACVRGHRVSNCQHTDRPLQHINKKGRPVSQCQHCRTMRKSRSTHVKCDCGEKTSKCAHLQQPVEGHKETCCCNHGGHCTCSLKKETSLDTVPESDSDGESQGVSCAPRPKAPARRRRANTVHSDGVMAFDQNGHHKPTAKHNRAAQKCGPYQLSRVNSATSASSLGASSECMVYQAGGEGQSLGGRSRVAASREPRRVKSETASPLMSGSSFPQLNGPLPPLDLSRIEYPSYVGSGTFEMFGSGMTSEQEAPMYSAALSAASVDWSHYDLGEAKGDFAPSSYSQAGAQSFNGLFDFGSGSEQLPRLANTTSTSGEVSEVEDFMGNGDGDLEGFRAGNNNSGFVRQGNMVGNLADLSSIDYDSFYSKNADNAATTTGAISMVEEDPAFWMPNYNDGVATMDESPDPLGASSMGSFWEI